MNFNSSNRRGPVKVPEVVRLPEALSSLNKPWRVFALEDLTMCHATQNRALTHCPFTHKNIDVTPILQLAHELYGGWNEMREQLDHLVKMLVIMRPAELKESLNEEHYALLFDLRDAFELINKGKAAS